MSFILPELPFAKDALAPNDRSRKLAEACRRPPTKISVRRGRAPPLSPATVISRGRSLRFLHPHHHPASPAAWAAVP
jgi:hypothetical protein